MDSDRGSAFHGLLRQAWELNRDHWLVMILLGVPTALGIGYNLTQFALYGRLYIVVPHEDYYWAYWHTDPVVIVGHGLLNLGLFGCGAGAVAAALLHSLLTLVWGKAPPRYADLPPLSFDNN
jgi:hypothetical protein